MYTPHTVSLIIYHGDSPSLVYLRGVMLQALNGRSVQRRGGMEENEATLYVAIGTNVVSYKDISGDEVAQAHQRLHEAMEMGYERLKIRHEQFYHQLYDRKKSQPIHISTVREFTRKTV